MFMSLKKGYSMMELMIYIAIVAMLAMVAIPSFMSYQKKATITSTKQTLLVYKDAISRYHLDTNRYPETLYDLVKVNDSLSGSGKWCGPYVELRNEELPKDSWDNDVVYKLLDSNGQKPYELYSWGSENADETPEEEWVWAS